MDVQNINIYHITHIDNLPGILAQGGLLSDSEMRQRDLDYSNIGYSHIKERRLHRPVQVAAQGYLGDYVPFNFCNRSVMLYVISRKNPDLNYQAGQEPIIYLVTNLHTITTVCNTWTFTDRHAELAYAAYYENLDDLKNIDFKMMTDRYWIDTDDYPDKKECRQAEFLVHHLVPWNCIMEIGVYNESYRQLAAIHVQNAQHKPAINIHRDWYY